MEPDLSDKKIAELLPFWVNGSLAADEQATVAAAVVVAPALAAEAAFLQGLRARMQAEDAGFSPADLGLARLKRSIAMQPVAETPARSVSLRLLAAAAVVAALLGYTANQSFGPAPYDPGAAEYVQASGGDDAGALVVGFQPTATAQAISEYLLAEGAIILDGPSAVGLYRVAPVDGAATDLAALADRLQSRGDLFDVVDLPE